MEWLVTMENIDQVAREFWQANRGKTVFAFHGPMGSGKTTFIRALCAARGVKDTVGSPTFSLVNEYAYANGENGKKEQRLYHLDLYRLKDEEEAIRAGMEDVLYSGHPCLVEWPEKAPGILPPGTVPVLVEWVDTLTRRIKIAGN